MPLVYIMVFIFIFVSGLIHNRALSVRHKSKIITQGAKVLIENARKWDRADS